MADSKVSDLTANTEPEARDEFYHVDLSQATVSDRSKKATLQSIFNSVIIHYDEIVALDGNILTL